MRGSKVVFGVTLAVAVLAAGCGGSAVQQPVVPAQPSPGVQPPPPAESPPASPAAPVDPFAIPEEPKDVVDDVTAQPVRLDAWDAAVKAKGVAPPPAECAAFAKRAPAQPVPPDLVTALATKDAGKRDAMLVALEPSSEKALPGVVRGLRADLAPVACADGIIDPYLAAHRTLVSRVSHVLVGLSLAAKLERTGAGKPSMGAATDKEKVKAFVVGPLKKWMVEQSTAIETLSSGAAGLTGYGRGVAALAAGIADMRLVEAIRSAPTPPSWDPELKAIYQATLDEALEPRKKRGRDAALVGLSDLAQAGVLVDARSAAAHALLTSLYGGRRIGALADLMVPKPADVAPSTPRQIAMASLPTYWVGMADVASRDEADASAMLARGTPPLTTILWATSAPDKIKPETRTAYARSRLRQGQLSWRRIDFLQAARVANQGKTPEDRLIVALSLALAHGPNGAAEMMRAPTPSAFELQHTEALDVVASENGPYAGWAAFDAAHLRSLSPPEGAAAGPYFTDVAARFRKAETLLTDPAKKKLALQRAEEIDKILAAMNRPKS